MFNRAETKLNEYMNELNEYKKRRKKRRRKTSGARLLSRATPLLIRAAEAKVDEKPSS